MKRIKTLLASIALAGTLIFSSGCSNLGNGELDVEPLKLPIMYGTLKVIEDNNGVDKVDVLELVEKLEVIFVSNGDTEVILDNLSNEIISLIDMDSLSSGDQLIVYIVLDSVELAVRKNLEEEEVEKAIIKVNKVIDYVEMAAKMT